MFTKRRTYLSLRTINPGLKSRRFTLRTLSTVLVCVSVLLQAVSATFDELSLEEHDTCSYDSVSLYDGSSSISSSLGKFCTSARSTITSSNSSLFVVFRTDSSNNRGRFSLNWTFVSSGGQGRYDVHKNFWWKSVVPIDTSYPWSYRNVFDYRWHH